MSSHVNLNTTAVLWPLTALCQEIGRARTKASKPPRDVPQVRCSFRKRKRRLRNYVFYKNFAIASNGTHGEPGNRLETFITTTVWGFICLSENFNKLCLSCTKRPQIQFNVKNIVQYIRCFWSHLLFSKVINKSRWTATPTAFYLLKYKKK